MRRGIRLFKASSEKLVLKLRVKSVFPQRIQYGNNNIVTRCVYILSTCPLVQTWTSFEQITSFSVDLEISLEKLPFVALVQTCFLELLRYQTVPLSLLVNY